MNDQENIARIIYMWRRYCGKRCRETTARGGKLYTFADLDQLEHRIDAFFKKNNLPFHYVGDGELWIGGKCPDFVCNPLKLVIEVGSKTQKEAFGYSSWKDYEKERKVHFKRYFFDCLCLWEEDLKTPQKTVEKIRGFLKC